MERKKLLSFLRSNELFSQFTDQEREELLPYFKEISVEKGEWIVREGEGGENLFILLSGEAQVIKEDLESAHKLSLRILKPGEWIGEMAFIEKAKRSASILATERCEVLFFLLESLEFTPGADGLYHKIAAHLAKKISQRLRQTDENLVASLTENVRILQGNNVLGRAIVHIFVLLALWFNVALLVQYIPSYKRVIEPVFSECFLVLFGICTFFVIKDSGYPFAFFGLTLKKWASVAWEAILYTVPILLFVTILKWFLVTHISLFEQLPVFAYKPIYQTTEQAFLFGMFYLITVPVQEFVIRGGVQTFFRNFFLGPNRVYMAILTSNLIFEMLHTVKNLPLSIITFTLGLFWGTLMERQKSLVGVITSHLMLGIWGFFVIDIQSILDLLK